MRRFIRKAYIAFPVLVAVGFLPFHIQDVLSQSITQADSSQSFNGRATPGCAAEDRPPADLSGDWSGISRRSLNRARRTSKRLKMSTRAWDRG